MKIELKTKGMHCVSCERILQDSLIEIDGIEKVKANYVNEKTEIIFDSKKINPKSIMKVIQNVGYEPEKYTKKESQKGGFLKNLFGG